MPRTHPRILWVAIPLVWLIYFQSLGAIGLLGPDEPRYASIGREMARSGDWITPRLWGDPWFEKPALLYWLQGAAFRLGVPADLAPRLPIALLAVAFLVFYWWILRREFGCRAAWMAALILGTSGMWVGWSQAGVTDLPLTATYSAAMLLALPWVARRETRWLPISAAFFGFAVLAKGIVPIALAAPLLAGRHVRDWLRPRVVLPFFVIGAPWYLLCYARNGWQFIHDFFIVHTFSRVTSGALMHRQPVWFYLPILLAALLPWTPLLAAAFRRKALHDPRRLFLLAWAAFVLIAFSISVNKLPGYILPALPAIAALIAIRLDEPSHARLPLAVSGLLLAVFPIASQLLPAAFLSGLSHAPPPHFEPVWLLPIAIAAAAWELDRRGRRLAAVAAIAAGAAIGIGWLKVSSAPQLERYVSARGLWRQIEPRRAEVCIGDVKRDWDYGLAYYAGAPLPDCAVHPLPLQIVPGPRNSALLRPKQ